MIGNFFATLTVAGLLVSSASATTITWDLMDGLASGHHYNSTSYSANDGEGDVALTATAWADTGWGGALQQGKLGVWFNASHTYGMGVCNAKENCSQPEHSMDNYHHTDMVLLTFDEDVMLNGFDLGWHCGWSTCYDTDVTMLAYTSSDAFSSLAGDKWTDLDGWTKVGHYANADASITGPAANETFTDISSKYWLIGAYNPIFSGPMFGEASAFGAGNDFFKLKAITTTRSTQVPEPASVVLLGLALLGFGAVRRRT